MISDEYRRGDRAQFTTATGGSLEGEVMGPAASDGRVPVRVGGPDGFTYWVELDDVTEHRPTPR